MSDVFIQTAARHPQLSEETELTLAEDGGKRVEQVKWKLKHNSWQEIAEFCSLHLQAKHLQP